MFLTFYGRRTHSGWEDIRLRREAATRAEFFEAQVVRIASAYIKESNHPDCLPSHRFRITMPDGTMQYRATRQEADDLFYSTHQLTR